MLACRVSVWDQATRKRPTPRIDSSVWPTPRIGSCVWPTPRIGSCVRPTPRIGASHRARAVAACKLALWLAWRGELGAGCSSPTARGWAVARAVDGWRSRSRTLCVLQAGPDAGIQGAEHRDARGPMRARSREPVCRIQAMSGRRRRLPCRRAASALSWRRHAQAW